MCSLNTNKPKNKILDTHILNGRAWVKFETSGQKNVGGLFNVSVK
jgi:hypothetical protein